MQIIDDYNSYKDQLGKKYPGYGLFRYSEMMNGVLKSFLENEAYLEYMKFDTLIPKDSCYISFSVVRKDENSHTPSNEILAFVADSNGEIKSFSIAIDDKFFDTCNLYHDLLAYNESMFLLKLSDGTYKITKERQKPEGSKFVESAEGIDELSAQIGEKLLSPLAEYISSSKNWIISSDGELNSIPFETLKFNGNFAVESKNICYVPSLEVLKLMKNAGEKNIQLTNRKEFFAMGNAVYSDLSESERKRGNSEILDKLKRSPDYYVYLPEIKWDNLKHTGEEIEQVASLFPADSQTVMTGREASEQNLKQLDKSGELAQYKKIHFATHGLFLPEKPELSSIVLSQGLNDIENDGYVTVGEWMGYNLNSDLVCLSACQSGLGEYQSGEGIIGIPYALTVAGNKDTLMSLWEVDDKATVEFMATFFKKLSDGESEIVALNETKREFLRKPRAKLKNPSVWAAFLLYGI